MRVALIAETFLPQVNGVVTTICRLLEHIQQRGHEALLFAPVDAPTSYAGAQVVPLASTPLPFYPEIRFTPPQPGVTAQLRAFRPDIVHLIGPAVLGATSLYASQQLGVPVVSSYHTDFPAYARHYGMGALQRLVWRYLRWLHNHCRCTLCPSRATVSELRARGFRRLRVWGRGVDTERFTPAKRSQAWRDSLGIAHDERVLLYVGRLASEKRLEMLPQALRGMKDVKLVLVGDGPAREELAAQVRGLPVRFTGYLQGEQLATAYASADLFIFPSDTETFGQVVQEALASGLPVVGARAGGTPDLVQEGANGLLFAPGNSNELRQQVHMLLEKPELRARMGECGRNRALQRSWPMVLDQLLEHYTHVTQRVPHRSTRRVALAQG